MFYRSIYSPGFRFSSMSGYSREGARTQGNYKYPGAIVPLREYFKYALICFSILMLSLPIVFCLDRNFGNELKYLKYLINHFHRCDCRMYD